LLSLLKNALNPIMPQLIKYIDPSTSPPSDTRSYLSLAIGPKLFVVLFDPSNNATVYVHTFSSTIISQSMTHVPPPPQNQEQSPPPGRVFIAGTLSEKKGFVISLPVVSPPSSPAISQTILPLNLHCTFPLAGKMSSCSGVVFSGYESPQGGENGNEGGGGGLWGGELWIIVGDKVGDVTLYPYRVPSESSSMESTTTNTANIEQQISSTVILTHTASILTGMSIHFNPRLCGQGLKGEEGTILTTDRDGILRVSNFPDAEGVRGYLLPSSAPSACSATSSTTTTTAATTSETGGSVGRWISSHSFSPLTSPSSPPGSIWGVTSLGDSTLRFYDTSSFPHGGTEISDKTWNLPKGSIGVQVTIKRVADGEHLVCALDSIEPGFWMLSSAKSKLKPDVPKTKGEWDVKFVETGSKGVGLEFVGHQGVVVLPASDGSTSHVQLFNFNAESKCLEQLTPNWVQTINSSCQKDAVVVTFGSLHNASVEANSSEGTRGEGKTACLDWNQKKKKKGEGGGRIKRRSKKRKNGDKDNKGDKGS